MHFDIQIETERRLSTVGDLVAYVEEKQNNDGWEYRKTFSSCLGNSLSQRNSHINGKLLPKQKWGEIMKTRITELVEYQISMSSKVGWLG